MTSQFVVVALVAMVAAATADNCQEQFEEAIGRLSSEVALKKGPGPKAEWTKRLDHIPAEPRVGKECKDKELNLPNQDRADKVRQQIKDHP